MWIQDTDPIHFLLRTMDSISWVRIKPMRTAQRTPAVARTLPRRRERTTEARRAGTTEIPATGRRPAPPLPTRKEVTTTNRTGTKTGTATTTVTVAATAATVTRVTEEDAATGAVAAEGPAGRPTTSWSGNCGALRRLPNAQNFHGRKHRKPNVMIKNFIVVAIYLVSYSNIIL
jgi:hypothetical protein